MKKILLGLTLACLGLGSTSQAQVIWLQTFETPTVPPALPATWTQSSTGTTPWHTATAAGTTWGSLTNAYNLPAHTTYVVVDDAANPTQLHDTLKSAVFTMATTPNAWLKYDYFFYKATNTSSGLSESCFIIGSTNGGTTWHIIDSVGGTDGGNGWNGSWSTGYVNLSTLTGANCMIAYVYSDGGGAILGCALDNIQVYTPPTHDFALTAIAPNSSQPWYFGAAGSTQNFVGTVFNYGYTTETSFTVTYQQGATTAVPYTFTGVSIPPFTSYNFTDPTGYVMPATLGNYPFNLWVTLTGDAVLSNDSMTTSLTTVSFMPTKRIMFEEPTGSWCGWCVRGIVYMDSMWSVHSGNVSISSVHDYNSYDPMAIENTTTTHYDTYIQTIPGFSGFPGLVVDRHFVADPSDVFTYYSDMSNFFGFADMTITATYSNFADAINVSGTIKPAQNLSGDYRVELILTEDKVHGTASGYAQHDYYSFQNQNLPLAGEGYNFQDSTQVINATSMYFKFVDRWTVPDLGTSPNGIASSLPATMTSGTTYNYTIPAVTIASDWVVANMRAIVLLIDNNPTSLTYKQILNSINAPIAHNVGVANVAAGVDDLNIYPNPAKDQVHVLFTLKDAGQVHFTVTDVLGREMFIVPSESMNAGGQQINFSTAGFAPGSYNVTIATETGTLTQHLSVIK